MCQECTQKFLTKTLIAIVCFATAAIIVTIVATNGNITSSVTGEPSEDTLVALQIVFRHGHRTPEPGKLYKLDPYNNHSFYPENYGELTTKGRQSAYNLGVILREQYRKFLPTDFHPGIVRSYTSRYDRTQMSLQCVHAGLFPNEKSILSIPWRPVAYETLDLEEDRALGILSNCKSLKVPRVAPEDEETAKLFEFLSEKSGERIETYLDVLAVSNAFLVETGCGLELPSWGKHLYPQPILALDEKAWAQFAKANIRVGAGGLLRLITRGARNVERSLLEEGRFEKVVLYSGHDYNLFFLRRALGIPDIDSSTFSAHMIFELHSVNGILGFKILYNNYKEGHPIVFKVPFCKADSPDGSFCKLSTFAKNTRWYYDPQPAC